MNLKEDSLGDPLLVLKNSDQIKLQNHLSYIDPEMGTKFYGTNNSCKEDIDVHGIKTNKVILFLTAWSIEPVLFLFIFASKVNQSCIMNLMLDKACLNHLQYSKEICRNLSHYEERKIEAERVANIYNQYATLATMGIGVFVMIFAGSWTDKYGRKPLLMMASIGMLLEDIGILLNIIYFNATLPYLVLSFIASGATGGYNCVIAMLSSLASDMSSMKLRTIKFAVFEFTLGFGSNFGVFTGGILYKYYSYKMVYAVAAAAYVISLLWSLLFIPETKGQDEQGKVHWIKKLRDLFSLENFKGGFKVFVKLRPYHGRLQLWLLLGSLCTLAMTYRSFYNIAYVYAFHMYNWDPSTFSMVFSAFGTMTYISILLCVPILVRVCKLDDPVIGFIGTMSLASKNLCIALAIHPWIYYLGNTLGLMNTAGRLAARALISKTVEKDELGKAFTFTLACEALVPLASAVAMTHIYNATVTFFPGLCYLLTATMLILPAVSFWWIGHFRREQLIQEQNSNTETDQFE